MLLEQLDLNGYPENQAPRAESMLSKPGAISEGLMPNAKSALLVQNSMYIS